MSEQVHAPSGNGGKLLVAIVGREQGEKIVALTKNAGARGGTILLGKGTAESSLLQLLGIGDSEKDLVLTGAGARGRPRRAAKRSLGAQKSARRRLCAGRDDYPAPCARAGGASDFPRCGGHARRNPALPFHLVPDHAAGRRKRHAGSQP